MTHAIDIAYVRYQVPDLAVQQSFLEDFGMSRAGGGDAARVFMRGSGDAPFVYEAVRGEKRFLGAGFRVGSRDDLERLAGLPGSTPIERANDVPGGGERVRMRMTDGFEIDAICGAEPATPLPARAAHAFNAAGAKARGNTSIRVARQPAPVQRLGHCVLHVRDHDAAVRWLYGRLGLVASDHMAVPGDESHVIGTFLRVDAGRTFVDHHCLLVLGTERPGVHHASFEVEDFDAVMAGHDFLLECGHVLDCGVGRHLLGSQIFDYWRDPFGFRIEHYTDGDVVNDAHRPSVFAGTAEQTTQWGAKPPLEFFT